MHKKDLFYGLTGNFHKIPRVQRNLDHAPFFPLASVHGGPKGDLSVLIQCNIGRVAFQMGTYFQGIKKRNQNQNSKP